MNPRCFVAGQPIAHSRSPLIHGHWLTEHAIAAEYGRVECGAAELPSLLARVRSGDLLGGNLTVPLKEAALPLLDEVTPEARDMGAVNTVFRREGALWGANTDVPGYFAHLDQTCPGWDAEPVDALVLGAGGAARAIIWGLLRRNLRSVTVANRSPDRALALAASLGDPRIQAAPWPPSPKALAGAGLIINATSLGMKGQPALDLAWPDDLSRAIVSDIVYVPLITPMLEAAGARGARTVDGLGMLLHQAALAFAFWFGVTPRVTPELREKVAADIPRRAADLAP